MKVLQFGKYYYPVFGGMEHVIYEMTEGLNDSNIQCDVLCCNTTSSYEETIFGKYTVFRTATYARLNSTAISPQLIFKLWRKWREYDVIHVHHPDPMAFLALYIVRPKNKVVVHWHSDIIRQKKLLRLFAPLQAWVLERADSIIATSQEYAFYSKHLNLLSDKVQVIPIGISNKEFCYEKECVDKIKKEYKNKKIILGIGRLVSYKGFNYLIEAARYLTDDYVVLIAGVGPEEESLRSLIKKYQLEKKVELLGYISEKEKYAYFQKSYIFCLPSITKAEAYGVVLLEAMAFSKPIVSTNIKESGVSWVNAKDITGMQVKSKDSRALATAILEISKDTKAYDSFSKNSYQRYISLFTREKMITSLVNLYKSMA